MINLFGLLFIFFIPGFLITNILFKKFEQLEKIILYVALSVAFYVFIGLMLGFNELSYRITGGLSNLWIFSLVLNAGLFVSWRILSKKPKAKVAETGKKKHIK